MSKLPAQSERSFQDQVIALARFCRWRVAHFRPGMMRNGHWVTPVQGDGAGFPDLVLVRKLRIIFAELKSDKGTTSPAQEAWLDALDAVPGVEVYEWRPAQWQLIEQTLA